MSTLGERITKHWWSPKAASPVASLVPIEEVDLGSFSLGTNPEFLALIAQARARCQPGAGISTCEMRERLTAR